MTARVAGFVSRAAAGLAPPRSVSRNISPRPHGGVAVHWGGPAQRIRDHAGCLKTWRAWQRFHVGTNGWADLAYTGGACDHGYALAGRGVGVRTAANGTDAGNDAYYAVVWLGGQGEQPTRLALDAFDWWVLHLRANGAGTRVVPHGVFTGSTCPGAELARYASTRDRRPVPTDRPAPPPAKPTPPAPAPAPAPPRPQETPMARLIRAAGQPHVYGTDGVGRRWHVPSPEVLADLRRSGIYGDGVVTEVSPATVEGLVLVEPPAPS